MTTTQHLRARRIPRRRLLCHSSWVLCVQWRGLHQCVQGKGKVRPLIQIEKNPRFHRAFRQIGDDWNIKPQVLTQLEQFTCLMYGQSRESPVDVIRTKLLRTEMVGEDKKLTSKSYGQPGSPSSLPLCFEAAHSACEPPRCLVQASE